MRMTRRSRALALALGVLLLGSVRAQAVEPYSEQGFMDAAQDNCSRVEKRDPKSCACEQKLIKDRLSAEDKEMAYYYWTDKTKYVEKFEEKRGADESWQAGFGERFSILQASSSPRAVHESAAAAPCTAAAAGSQRTRVASRCVASRCVPEPIVSGRNR